VIYGAAAGEYTGYGAGFADLNGDGYMDLITGAPYASPGSKAQAGKVWIIYGSSSGLPTTVDLASPPANASVIYGADAGDKLGLAITTGDLNADGFDDLILGAELADGPSNGRSDAGEVWILYGDAPNFPATPKSTPEPRRAITWHPPSRQVT
jgi:hypothetical protein